MSYSKYKFTLDLRSVESQMGLQVTQGDTNRELVVSFSDGGKPVVLANGSVALMSIVRPNGTAAQESCEVDENGTYVVYKFSENTCPGVGLHKCQIVLYNAEKRQIAAPKFAINASAKLVLGDDILLPEEDVLALDAIYRAEAERQAFVAELRRQLEAGELKGEKGDKGDVYVLTAEDKKDILSAVLEEIPDGDEVLY